MCLLISGAKFNAPLKQEIRRFFHSRTAPHSYKKAFKGLLRIAVKWKALKIKQVKIKKNRNGTLHDHNCASLKKNDTVYEKG